MHLLYQKWTLDRKIMPCHQPFNIVKFYHNNTVTDINPLKMVNYDDLK